MQPQRVRHHVRHDDVPLDLVDEDEERRHPEDRDRVDDERVDRGGTAESHGPMYGITSITAVQSAEEERVVLGARHEAGARRGSTCRRPRSCR